MFSCANSAQCNCNPATVKLELLCNIPLVLDANNLKHCKKAMHKIESSSAKRNPFVLEGVNLSFAECNPSIVQKMESSFAKYNTSVFAKLCVIDDGNDVKLRSDTIIRANKHVFKLVNAVGKYVKMFGYNKDCLIIEIQIIENCKTKISIKSISYTQSAISFFKDGF